MHTGKPRMHSSRNFDAPLTTRKFTAARVKPDGNNPAPRL